MSISGRNRTMALVAAALTVGGQASAEDAPVSASASGKATIVLHVSNYAACRKTSSTWRWIAWWWSMRASAQSVVWIDDNKSAKRRDGAEFHLTVLLLSRDMAERKISADGIKNGVLGQAHPPSGRAHIFCERIATMPGVPRHIRGAAR